MSMKRCVRVSSSVVLLPSRADTRICTRGSGCFANSLNASSVLANAQASLPVFGLTLRGSMEADLNTGSPVSLTRSPSNSSANLSLDISVSLSAAAASSKRSFRALTSSKCCSSSGKSNSNDGSMNIRSVASITFSSCLGKSAPIIN